MKPGIVFAPFSQTEISKPNILLGIKKSRYACSTESNFTGDYIRDSTLLSHEHEKVYAIRFLKCKFSHDIIFFRESPASKQDSITNTDELQPFFQVPHSLIYSYPSVASSKFGYGYNSLQPRAKYQKATRKCNTLPERLAFPTCESNHWDNQFLVWSQHLSILK